MNTQRRKILLYNPRAVFFTMPLGLLAIASNLDPARFEVIIVDGRLTDDPLAALRPHLPDALCLGVSVLTGAPIRDALCLSRAVKTLQPDLPVVWGGWHPSLFPTECLAEKAIDITAQGQGEATFRELVERLAAGESLQGVAGLAYRAGGTIQQNPARPLCDMNTFPPARYDLIPVEEYFRRKQQRQLDYISSIGCHFRCAFCADPQVFKRKWNGIAPERMGEELEQLWHRFAFADLNFQDETFFTHADRVAAIAEEFLRRHLRFTWAGTLRADQAVRMPDDLFALCRRAGLRRVMVGVESGDPQTLRWLKKDITIEQVFATAERCKRFNLAAIFPFIVGFPQESPESVAASLQAAKRLRAMSPKFETVIFFYQPYPGSPLADLVRTRGYPMPQALEEWAAFDYVESRGAWVSPEKWEYVQRFKFYHRFAWSENGGWVKWPVRQLARWRCQHDFYAFPIEKKLAEWLRPAAPLS
ncbi:MAG: B12-binding domain-containing radical SAM protein [candidate division KSB1 bacterium]|nr:B12-binding domain-containing radical SAM protein [candidate division KSB1 bacterium]MDZ7275876.1 B12-binding domain-containing radical SAM protein [candidate division KSB1 bacterium]MDZ7287626.1 B12-binding domain-containing radical SAM protein [candidate division KSB1 bacterium]MDZ7306788.1 B12-binding domain-containing radical SAM protein [candidate division KSB1 bacterium]MDZ7350604.1 B12-binding domain-containing radical SAM protein [candidate division KSB1 bacterium]